MFPFISILNFFRLEHYFYNCSWEINILRGFFPFMQGYKVIYSENYEDLIFEFPLEHTVPARSVPLNSI